jgi:hypothetical protein
VGADDPGSKAVDAAIAEFNALRAESLAHSQVRTTLFGAGLTAAGVIVGVAVKEKAQDLLFLVPFLASLIGLLYVGEDHKMWVLGQYVDETLWPYVQRRTDPKLPSWEAEIRRLRTDSRRHKAISFVGGFGGVAVCVLGSAAALVVLGDHLDDGSWATAAWVFGALATLACLAFGIVVGREYRGEKKKAA